MNQRVRGMAYMPFRRINEQAQALFYGNGWLARWMHSLGLQQTIFPKEYDIVARGWPAQSRPLRVVFASDFHAGPITAPPVIEQACQALRDAEPDVLLLGGDFISLHARYIDTLVSQLQQVSAPLGRFAVMGNHDIWADEHYIVQQLESAGIRILMNENVRLPDPFAHVWICGLDDPFDGLPDPERALAGADGFNIVLMHSPRGLNDIQNYNFDLALCGHTHGGQVALASGEPIVLPPGSLNHQVSHGLFRVGPAERSLLLISRGIGYSGIPFRIYAFPDFFICSITFT